MSCAAQASQVLLCRKVSGALKIVHEQYQKTDLYSSFLSQFSDAVTKNEFIEAHLRKVGHCSDCILVDYSKKLCTGCKHRHPLGEA